MDVRTRTGDQLKPMVASLNRMIYDMRCMYRNLEEVRGKLGSYFEAKEQTEQPSEATLLRALEQARRAITSGAITEEEICSGNRKNVGGKP